MNIDLHKHCPFCKKPIRLLIAPYQLDERLRFENEMLEKRIDILLRVFRAAQYVVQHRYGENDPVGTRMVAIEDLKSSIKEFEIYAGK